LNPASCWKYV